MRPIACCKAAVSLWVLASLVALLTATAAAGITATGEATGDSIVPLTIDATVPRVDLSALDPEAAERLEVSLRQEAMRLMAAAAAFGDVTGGYEVSYDGNDIVSVTMLYSGFAEGMAHPMHYRGSVTADLRTGQAYALSDLFADGRYADVLSERLAEAIVAQDIPLLGTLPSVGPDQDYYLRPDALVLYFQLYEIAPYAWGFPEVVVPYEDVVHLTPEGGLIRRVLGR